MAEKSKGLAANWLVSFMLALDGLLVFYILYFLYFLQQQEPAGMYALVLFVFLVLNTAGLFLRSVSYALATGLLTVLAIVVMSW